MAVVIVPMLTIVRSLVVSLHVVRVMCHSVCVSLFLFTDQVLQVLMCLLFHWTSMARMLNGVLQIVAALTHIASSRALLSPSIVIH